MKTLIKMEELALFLLGFSAFIYFGGTWYYFLLFLLAPDLGMIGYVINTQLGAVTYNLLHHKAIALSLFFLGIFLSSQLLLFIGIIIFSHSSFDRVLGYGLKYPDAFKHTHLGWIGGKEQA